MVGAGDRSLLLPFVLAVGAPDPARLQAAGCKEVVHRAVQLVHCRVLWIYGKEAQEAVRKEADVGPDQGCLLNGTVYGLVASDQPDVVRYVGASTDLVGRLGKHRRMRTGDDSRSVWVREVYARSATVELVHLASAESEDELRELEVRETARLIEAGHPILNRRPSRAGRKVGEKVGPMDADALERHAALQREWRDRYRDAGVVFRSSDETRELVGQRSAEWHASRSSDERAAAMRHARAARVTPRASCVLCRTVIASWNVRVHVGGRNCQQAQKKISS